MANFKGAYQRILKGLKGTGKKVMHRLSGKHEMEEMEKAFPGMWERGYGAKRMKEGAISPKLFLKMYGSEYKNPNLNKK